MKSQGPRPSLLPKATCAVPLCEEPSPCRGLRPHHAWKDRVGTWETSFGPQSLVDPGPRQEVEETKLSRNRRGVGRLHTVVHKDSISAIDPVPAIPGFFLWPRVGLWPRHFLECFRSSGINRDNSPMISSAALDSSSAPISLAVSMDRLDCALSSGFGSARCFIEDSLALTNFHP